MIATDDAGPLPWDRLEGEGETPRAYGAFRAYLDQGARRSLRKLAEGDDARKSNLTQMAKWSSAFHWPDRAAAWDRHIADEAAAAELEAVKDMRRRHASIATGLQRKALERLQAMDVTELSPSEVLAYLTKAVTMEAEARGLPGQLVGHVGGDGGPVAVEQADVDHDQMRRLRESLAARTVGRVDPPS